ncbi:MAG: hypothetical protein RL538_82 [Candidatus Parcubacteria bacterium]|jgi:thymidylate kinase
MSRVHSPKSLILEGVSGSGKTTIYQNLARYAIEHSIKSEFVSEERTVLKMLDSTVLSDNVVYLLNLLDITYLDQKDLTVFDRFHFTHTIKTNAGLDDFKEVEDILLAKETIILFLRVSKKEMYDRFNKALKYKSTKWVNYMRKAGLVSTEDLVEYHFARQNYFENLLNSTRLEHSILDVADYNYIDLTYKIIDILQIEPGQLL